LGVTPLGSRDFAQEGVDQGALALLDLAEDEHAQLGAVEAAGGVSEDVLAEAGEAELGGDVGEFAGAIVEGTGLRVFGRHHSTPMRMVRRWSQRASGQASAGTSYPAAIAVGWGLGCVRLALRQGDGLAGVDDLVDELVHRWVILHETAARADTGNDTAVVEVRQGTLTFSQRGEGRVPRGKLLAAANEGLGSGCIFARCEQAGAVGRERGEAAEGAKGQPEGEVGLVFAVGDIVGHEQAGVAALDMAQGLGQQEGALRRAQDGESGGIDDQPVVAAASVAERGYERPSVACGGGYDSDGGEGGAEQLGDPDDLLQKRQGDGTFGDLQLPSHQTLGDGAPAQFERAHECLGCHRLVEPAKAADIDAVGVGDAGQILLEGAELPALHEAAEIEIGGHWSDFTRRSPDLSWRRSKKVPTGTRTSLRRTADLGMPGNERSHGCCQAH
jgi:hypothetical protein